MNILNFKKLLSVGIIFLGSHLYAVIKAGVSKELKSYMSPPDSVEDVSGSKDWCISRVLDQKIYCNSESNAFLSNAHAVLCSFSVSLAPVLSSQNNLNELALGREVMPYKVYAFHAEVPGGNALALALNVPLYLFQTQTEGAINILTFNALDSLKKSVDNYTKYPDIVSAMQSVLEARRCSNYDGQFTEKITYPITLQKKLTNVEPCKEIEPNRYCGINQYSTKVEKWQSDVDQTTGRIISYSGIKLDEDFTIETEQFCGYRESAEKLCNSLYESNKLKLSNVKAITNQSADSQIPKPPKKRK